MIKNNIAIICLSPNFGGMKSIFPKLVLESINLKLGVIKNEYFSS